MELTRMRMEASMPGLEKAAQKLPTIKRTTWQTCRFSQLGFSISAQVHPRSSLSQQRQERQEAAVAAAVLNQQPGQGIQPSLSQLIGHTMATRLRLIIVAPVTTITKHNFPCRISR